MRNPNRFGTCYKLSGKRRNPFIARAYLGKKDGKPVYKTIGYFKTKSEGQQALLNYKFNPYNTDFSKITLIELFEMFKEEKEEKLTGFKKNYEVTFKHLESLYHFRVVDIKPYMMQEILNISSSKYTKVYVNKIKNCMHQLIKYAVRNDIVKYDYTQSLEVYGKEKKEQSFFTADEVRKMIECIGKVEHVEMILFMCFTGCRPSELLNIKCENIDLERNIIHSFGIKTETSKKKRVPIPSILIDFVLDQKEKGEKWLFPTSQGYQMLYNTFYATHYPRALEQCGIVYKPPKSARHFFATITNNEDINDKARKSILGHSNIRTTNEVYTHIEDEKIKKEYKKIEDAILNQIH